MKKQEEGPEWTIVEGPNGPRWQPPRTEEVLQWQDRQEALRAERRAKITFAVIVLAAILACFLYDWYLK